MEDVKLEADWAGDILVVVAIFAAVRTLITIEGE